MRIALLLEYLSAVHRGKLADLPFDSRLIHNKQDWNRQTPRTKETYWRGAGLRAEVAKEMDRLIRGWIEAGKHVSRWEERIRENMTHYGYKTREEIVSSIEGFYGVKLPPAEAYPPGTKPEDEFNGSKEERKMVLAAAAAVRKKHGLKAPDTKRYDLLNV